MSVLSDFLAHMDWWNFLAFLMSAVASLLCITVHELSHGFVAYRLGDPTAKNAGRLTWNPIKHIDPIGLVMMLIARVGWAKPVPVDMRYFKDPKRGMALTALAGPVSNFVLAALVLGLASLVYWSLPETTVMAFIVFFLCYVAVLSVGLGLFNLIPIPPLDGSKVLFSLLPDEVYRTILHYERYIQIIVLFLAWKGILSGPLDVCIGWVMKGLCTVTQFPFFVVRYYFGF